MKRELLAGMVGAGLIAVAGLALRGGTATAQERTAKAGDHRSVTASGTATIYVTPDSCRLYFTIETTGPRVSAARAQNAVAVTKVREALEKLKIPNLKSKTSDFTVQPVHPGAPPDRTRVSGYRVTNTFTVLCKSSDTETLNRWAGSILDTATDNGVNRVQSVTFFRTTDEATRRDALGKAVADAVANARAMAEVVTRGEVSVHEITGNPQYEYGMAQVQMNVAFRGGDDTTLVAGEIPVTCTAQVICRF